MNLVTLLFLIGVGVQGPVIGKTLPKTCGESNLLFLRHGTIDARMQGTPDSWDTLTSLSTRRFIVKFNGPTGESEKLGLQKNGAFVESYIPNYAFLVSCDSKNISKILAESGATWVSPYRPEWKIAPALLQAGKFPDTVHVWLFGDADLTKTARESETNLDANIYSTHEGLNKTMLVSIDRSRLTELASLDAVRWIEPFYAPRFFNNLAQWVLQSWHEDERDLWDRGLDGTGVVASTGDAGVTTNHRMFKDSTTEITTWGDFPTHRKVIAYQPSAPGAVFGDDGSSSVQYHGTHTGCTVCGDDSYWGGASPYDGMAKGAKLYFIDVGNNAGGIAYPADYNDMYILPWQGNSGGRAKVMSNSWGSGNPLRTYDIPARQTDEFMWDHQDFLIFYSAGNSSTSGISPPATAKNIVTVGATINGDGANVAAGFSSTGPAADGRIKPTITAPGMLTSADGASTDYFKFMEGTSMSSPAAAGACVILAQYFMEGWYPSGSHTFNSDDGFDPSAALLKALLINSTIADFSNPIPDNKIGWGRICLDSVLYFEGASKKLYVHDNSRGLATGDDATYTVDVTENTWPLRITLVWTDPPPEMAASKQLVNDLDLYAESPSGTEYLGNVFSAGYSNEGGASDAVNVEECLRINKPKPGTWKIHVKASNIPQGPQPYALVITGVMESKDANLAASGVRIDDSSNPSPNNVLDPQETVIIFPRLVNVGNYEASNVTAVVACSDSNVEIIDSTADYGTIQPGDFQEGSGFALSLSPDAQMGDSLAFTMTVTIAGGSRIDTIIFPIIVGLSAVEEKGPNFEPDLFCPPIMGPGTGIRLILPTPGRVALEIFDVTGRRVELLANEYCEAGHYEFHVQNDQPRGVYFVILNAGGYRRQMKTVRLGS